MVEEQLQKWQTQLNGFDKLSRASGPVPNPGKGEVLVKISAVSLNYRDTEGELREPFFHTSHKLTRRSHHGALQPPQDSQLGRH